LRLPLFMSLPIPKVLFVDEDPEAIHEILLKIEPLLLAYSLRRADALDRYIEEVRPHIVVLSDRVKNRRRDARLILSKLREYFRGKVLILTECITQAEEARWKERGADACLLHPTRSRPRLRQLSSRLTELFASLGNGSSRQG